MTCTVDSVGPLKFYELVKLVNRRDTSACNVKLGSYDTSYGASYTEHNGSMFVALSQIFMERDECFGHHDNIWQTQDIIT